MPKQQTKDEAGEVGLIGLAVALLSAGMERIGSDLAVGAALLGVGLVVLFVGVRFRNVRTGLDPQEVIAAISDRANEVANALADPGDGGQDGGGSE